MAARLSLDETLLKQLHQAGELQVEDARGVPIVLMTVDARQQLGQVVYDDSEWSAEEMMAVVAQQLDDPEGWGHPDMEVYDKEYGNLFKNDNGENQ